MAQITVAGASGDVGGRIVRALLAEGATVKAIVRPGSEAAGVLNALGATAVSADFHDHASLVEACKGSECVISALSGTTSTIKIAQGQLLRAAEHAGTQRFIPSDFSIDYTQFERGRNRNCDLRRDFWQQLESTSLRGTSIFNGGFAYLLVTPGFIDRQNKKVLYWGDDDGVQIDYTTLDDLAAFTARAALDCEAPRALHIASVTKSARELAEDASSVTGEKYTVLRCGSLHELRESIQSLFTADPDPDAHGLPMWQAMQYAENINSGFGHGPGNDNERYGKLRWTSIEEILEPLRA